MGKPASSVLDGMEAWRRGGDSRPRSRHRRGCPPRYPAKACIVCKSNQSVNWSLKVLQDRPRSYSPLWAGVLAIGAGKSCKGV